MNIIHRLRFVADSNADKIAVASVDGELSYEELYDQTDRYARALKEYGVKEGDRFSLVMENSNRMLTLLLAGWQIGAVPAPINIRLKDEDITELVEDAGSSLVIADQKYQNKINESDLKDKAALHWSSSDKTGFESVFPEEVRNRTVSPRGDQDDAIFLHTAGTTGRPKWVRISHGNLAASMGAMIGANLGVNDVGLHYYPLYHSGGIDMTLCRLLIGATTIVGSGWDPSDALSKIEEYSVDGITVVPQMGYELVHQNEINKYDLSSLSYFLVGSDTVTEELADKFLSLGAQPMQAYGLTETMAVIAVTKFGDIDCPLDSTGKVIEDIAKVRIVDPETGQEVDSGEIGEILISGDKLAHGYHNRPDKEREVYEDGWLHTEDLGTVDEDGYLYITGRLDNMMIVGGENVYPTDVEETLVQHPAISQAVVIAIPDERKGEIPVANVVLRDGEDLTEKELQQWFISQDAAFKHPRVVRFLNELPKTALGKINRSQLQQELTE
ncbi:class I adenylate-forming enzyme family protein [Halobellus captivus]|uniref:class I adenylate-forming enzyme family protein n=1 Tax=Halobellus captivus TaxID=2592614 RepID=UPI0011A3B3D5|nr:class I adenylate-forming enzyme family protein [Halobellus captivus]